MAVCGRFSRALSSNPSSDPSSGPRCLRERLPPPEGPALEAPGRACLDGHDTKVDNVDDKDDKGDGFEHDEFKPMSGTTSNGRGQTTA